MKLFLRHQARKTRGAKQTTRLRIFLWAFLISLALGAIYFFEPLEDLYRGGRNLVRARPADGTVVVVAVDDETTDRLGGLNYSRSFDAQLVDRLFAMGARRIYFDRTFRTLSDPASDQAFVEALERHPGKVFLGIIKRSGSTSSLVQRPIRPDKLFATHAELRSVSGKTSPFSLSASLVYGLNDNGSFVPSVSADIAEKDTVSEKSFRPDWSIQYSTVPMYGMKRILDGRVQDQALRGKDVIVGDTTVVAHDFMQVIGQGWFPAVFAHAIGAQTLKEGTPRDIGFLPTLFIAAAFSIWTLQARAKRTRSFAQVTGVAVGIVAPFILDALQVSADYIPAILMFSIVSYRAASLQNLRAASQQNAGTLLPNLAALREVTTAGSNPLIAMRIRNYAAVCASFSEPVEDELVVEVARRLTLPGHQPTYYQAEDVLYWIGPALSVDELEGHVSGLARLIESQFAVRGRKLDIHVAFGIDTAFDRPVSNRIGRALLAADNAAATHKLFQFSTSSNDEDSAWELSLMSELDAAIDAGDIWIAYQPQFDLHTNQISGAEALVRWQHPQRGAISPEAFILPAEAHNRIQRLTFHVLEKAARAVRPLLAGNPDFRLSVNVSAGMLEQTQLPARISEILIRTGFPASKLTLEVTESAPFREHDAVRANLAGIAAIGIDLSIDDYGTGNATLEYLRSVPCQEIKIDRRFVAGLTSNHSDMLLVESTIELAHGLGRRVIAEGIEDPETLELLRAIGCDVAQGYYLAKPLRLEALESLLLESAASKAA